KAHPFKLPERVCQPATHRTNAPADQAQADDFAGAPIRCQIAARNLQQEVAEKENAGGLAFHAVVHEQVLHHRRDIRVEGERDVGAVYVRNRVHEQRDGNDAQPTLSCHRLRVRVFSKPVEARRILILIFIFSRHASITPMSFSHDVFDSGIPEIYELQTHAHGPAGSLPITEEMLRNSPSGDLFGMTQNAGMGWSPAEAGRKQFLILSTQGGLRAPDGKPIALGYHTGHWEIGLLVQAAAEEFRRLQVIPFAGFCSDPCDGRTQGTTGMFDSLPYRNDAAILFRRLARSLPL